MAERASASLGYIASQLAKLTSFLLAVVLRAIISKIDPRDNN